MTKAKYSSDSLNKLPLCVEFYFLDHGSDFPVSWNVLRQQICLLNIHCRWAESSHDISRDILIYPITPAFSSVRMWHTLEKKGIGTVLPKLKPNLSLKG